VKSYNCNITREVEEKGRGKEEGGKNGKIKVRRGQVWWEHGAPQHHHLELLAHSSLPPNLLSSTSWEVHEVWGRPRIRRVRGSNLNLPFYFSFLFQISEPRAQV
jgi:hypothetical protein